MQGAALGFSVGACSGALIAFYRGSSIATPTVVGGGLGALSIGSYYTTWHFLRNRCQDDNPGIHLVSGSVSGYLMSALAAGPRAMNLAIVCGGSAGVGIYFALTEIEKWRVRTGIQMARARSPPMTSEPALHAQPEDTHGETMARDKPETSWYRWLPIRKISDEEAAALIEERKRVHEIR